MAGSPSEAYCPGLVRRGPSREYSRIGALVDSLSVELMESNLSACAGSRFRLKTAPIDGKEIADLGIMITGSDSAKFVVGARLSRISELLCYFPSHKALDSFIHSAAVAVCHTITLLEAPKEPKGHHNSFKIHLASLTQHQRATCLKTKIQRRVDHVTLSIQRRQSATDLQYSCD
jgi:hypothetical protein